MLVDDDAADGGVDDDDDDEEEEQDAELPSEIDGRGLGACRGWLLYSARRAAVDGCGQQAGWQPEVWIQQDGNMRVGRDRRGARLNIQHGLCFQVTELAVLSSPRGRPSTEACRQRPH